MNTFPFLNLSKILVIWAIIHKMLVRVLLNFTVKAATLIFIPGSGSAISSAKEGKSGFIYNLVKVNQLFRPRKRACIS